MTSHGAKVAAFNLAEMKSKEADRREEEASVRVIHADVELSRQWTQLKAQADLVREASAAASAEALQMAIKMVQAEEELDESRRLGGETEYVNHPEAIAGIGVGWLPQISVASGGLAKTYPVIKSTESIQKYGPDLPEGEVCISVLTGSKSYQFRKGVQVKQCKRNTPHDSIVAGGCPCATNWKFADMLYKKSDNGVYQKVKRNFGMSPCNIATKGKDVCKRHSNKDKTMWTIDMLGDFEVV
jgi:hypothetical protein